MNLVNLKNLSIFLLGALFGVGGLYIYHSQSSFVELNAVKNPVERLIEVTVDEDLVENTSRNNKVLLEEIKSLKLQLADKEKGIAGTVSKSKSRDSETPDESEMTEEEYSKAMSELFKKMNKPNAEEERLGSIALEELKRNQPIELKELFSEKGGDQNLSNMQTENKYKKHLSQEKDINWAYEAESVLRNYYSNQQNSKFTVYRIDCRTSSCEIAGLIKFDSDVDINSKDIKIFTERGNAISDVLLELMQQEFFSSYFSVTQNIFSNINVIMSNPVPYSFILPRVKWFFEYMKTLYE